MATCGSVGKLAEQDHNAQEGVELALKQVWAEEAFVIGVREWAEQTTLDASRPFSMWAVRFFARHGGSAALEKLQSPAVLSVANDRTIHAALEQLNLAGVTIPANVVRPLLDKALADPETWPWTWVFEPALLALAASDKATADKLAEPHLDDTASPYHRAAFDYFRKSEGLPFPFEMEPPASMELTPAERKLLESMAEVSPAYVEICNGGLSQYFFNSAGSWWPHHVATLRAIGFEEGAAAIEEAAKIVHPKGASLDRDERIAQYAALSERKEKRLDELSKLFYSDAPRLRFMLRHKELFARLRKAREEAGMDCE